jgi:hypothetical protein
MRGTIVRLAAMSVIVMAGASLAACGTARSPATRPMSATTPASGAVPGPPAGNRAEALRLAREMLSKVVLPPGSARYSGPLPPELRQAGGFVATELASEHMAWQVPSSMRSTATFLQGHIPAGMTAWGNGQTSDPSGPIAEEVDFSPHPLPAGIDESVLIFQVAPGAHGGSILRADAKVTWYPRRSAAERVLATTRRVTVTAVSVTGRKPHKTVRVFDSPAVIATLAGLLNGLHADSGGPRSCPAITTTYTLAFSTSPAARPYLVADVTGCGVVGITAGGRPQPALDDRGSRVLVAVMGLLKSRA